MTNPVNPSLDEILANLDNLVDKNELAQLKDFVSKYPKIIAKLEQAKQAGLDVESSIQLMKDRKIAAEKLIKVYG